jgi:16S rRNA (guanine966-N2)-methyltransferase
MRVVAGSARGRRLAVPPGTSVRPTSDRVREAVFNALGSLDAIDGATVVDLFAGSGALGIEALSRGAAHATFVDRDRAAVDCVRANLASCGLADRSTVVRGDGAAWAAGAPRHDLALLDPPYAFDEWSSLLLDLPAGLVVVESDRPVELPGGWEIVRDRRYGTTHVRVARRLPHADRSELP